MILLFNSQTFLLVIILKYKNYLNLNILYRLVKKKKKTIYDKVNYNQHCWGLKKAKQVQIISKLTNFIPKPNAKYNNFIYKSIWFRG